MAGLTIRVLVADDFGPRHRFVCKMIEKHPQLHLGKPLVYFDSIFGIDFCHRSL
jgi:hypothetical protein